MRDRTREVDRLGERGQVGEVAGDAGDVDAMVTHAFELVGHVQETQDLAQVARDRRLGEDHGQAVLVHLAPGAR